MEIKACIDEKYREMELHVCSDSMSQDVKNVMAELHDTYDYTLVATDVRGDRHVLRPADVVYFAASAQKVTAGTFDETFTVQEKLYELEDKLPPNRFVRISKSEIVGIRMIKSMDLSVTGTIRITMKNGYETYVSRRNVARIKDMLLKQKGKKS
ncbi:MAG: LytTR family transcriptional regulator [Lachnospiraceae bacterium]|nr:LytTR family transcriptional regulator [Lachnospiraceae bacterium]